MRTIILTLAVWLLISGIAAAQTTPEETLQGHFAAIQAEDYLGADKYFSAAFLKAFKIEVEHLNRYYFSRRIQLEPGYKLVETTPLGDPNRETCRIAVDFQDPDPEAAVKVAERIYYYLIREKVAGGPLIDREGKAWRIDICDAVRYETLADARRRPYLYTRESWDDSGSRELKSLQGLFQIHVALAAYYQRHGQYPFRLQGGDNRRDDLIGGSFLLTKYPPSGYDDRPMLEVDAAKRSPGDFAYYSVDADGDGVRESYWLTLHGAIDENYYFEGLRVVYILGPDASLSQLELAQGFAQFWQGLSGRELVNTTSFLASQTAGQREFAAVAPDSMLATMPADAAGDPEPQLSRPDDVAGPELTAPPVEIAREPSSVEMLEPVAPAGEPGAEEAEPATLTTEPAELQAAEQAEATGAELIAGADQVAGEETALPETEPEAEPPAGEEPAADQAPPAHPPYPEPGDPLVIYIFGW